MKKRILSFFLMFCLVVINMPMTVKAFQIKDNDKTKVEEMLNKLRKYYSDFPKEMQYLEAMAYLHSSDDFEKDRKFLDEKVRKIEYANNPMNCLKGIMVSVTLDKDPSKFDTEEGKTLNYVEGMLKKYNKVKHNFYTSDDTNAKCIISLDMVGADYNKEEVIKTLIDNFDRNKNINKAAIVLTALSRHRNLPGVNEGIQKYKEHLKSIQQDDGGFGENGNGVSTSYPPATAISEVIQALVAIGEDPLSEEWTKNGKTMLDALMEYQTIEDGSFSKNKIIGSGSWSLKLVTNEEATRSAFAALSDLYKEKSMYGGFQNGGDTSGESDPGTKPDTEPEEKTKAASIEILIDGNKIEDTLDMKVGESKSLILEVKDEKGNKIEDVKTEIEIEGQLINLQNEKITVIKEGIEKITIKCDEVKKIININIKKEQVKPEPKPDVNPKPEPFGKEEILDKKQLVAKTIKEIKEYYKQKKEKYTHLETLALIFSGTDKDEIKDKVEIYDYDSIKCLEENIMVIKAIGEDPTNYNNKNYIDLLLNPKEKGFNDNHISIRARRILALDMDNTEYDKEKDIKTLMSMATNDGEMVFGGREPKYNTSDISLIVTAIANHQDIEGVKDFIEKYKTYVRKVQLDNASFKNEYGSESCADLCDVIQALVAIGENPTSTKWAKTDEEGNIITLIDSLLKYKEGNQFKSNNDTYSSVSDIYTAHALAALADTLNGNSMYTNIGKQKINIKNIVIISEENLKEVDLNKTLQLSAKVFDDLDNEVLGKKITWESSNKDIATVDEKGLVNANLEGNVEITAKLKEDEYIKANFNVKVVDNKKAFNIEVLNGEGLKNGEDARISVKAKNNIESEKEVNIIVTLYNKSNETMVCYSCSEKSIKPEKGEIINTGFSIPKEGEFIVKILVWDNLKDCNSYCEPMVLNLGK